MDIRTERLRKAFYESGLSQTEVCERAQITKGAMSSYLAGRYFPKQKTLDRLSSVLNVSIEYLMGCGGHESIDDINALFIGAYGQEAFDTAMKYLQLEHDDKIRIRERMDVMIENSSRKDPSYTDAAI
jgi:transcriptional regulator with XRE-family HTH domain